MKVLTPSFIIRRSVMKLKFYCAKIVIIKNQRWNESFSYLFKNVSVILKHFVDNLKMFQYNKKRGDKLWFIENIILV